jgi:hypothetical protein
MPDSRVACLPYQYPVVGAVARVDTHTIAVPVRNLRADVCVAIIDVRNRLELACHVLPTKTREEKVSCFACLQMVLLSCYCVLFAAVLC